MKAIRLYQTNWIWCDTSKYIYHRSLIQFFVSMFFDLPSFWVAVGQPLETVLGLTRGKGPYRTGVYGVLFGLIIHTNLGKFKKELIPESLESAHP